MLPLAAFGRLLVCVVIDEKPLPLLDKRMERVRIRLLRDYGSRLAGESITVTSALARKLYRKGIAYKDKMITRSDTKK